MTGAYDQHGNAIWVTGAAKTLDTIRNYLEIPLAAPFAIAGMIHETAAVYAPVQQCLAGGGCR